MKCYDIICIGTGATSMYFGYKASKLAKRNIKILFLSKDSEIGGRIHSVSISGNPNYKAELCASRFYDTQPYVLTTAKELHSPLIVIKGSAIPTVTPFDSTIPEDLQKAYPNNGTSYTEISLATAITLSSNAYNVDRYAYETGYYLFTNNFGLDGYYHEYNTSGADEYRFVNGYQSFIKQMYNKVIKQYPVITNYLVESIKYSKSRQLYLINNKYACRKIIYTGTARDFNSIVTTIDTILNRRKLIKEYILQTPAIKCYLYFDKPFWGDLLYKYTGHPLLNQLIFYSKNTILLYLLSDPSNTLMNMVPIDQRRIHSTEYGTPNWEPSSKYPTFINYIKQQIIPIMKSALPQYNSPIPTQEQLDSLSSVLFQYRPQALGNTMPIKSNLLDPVFKSIQSGNNFYYLGGDVHKYGGGWVERCFDTVETNFDDIMNFENCKYHE